MTAGLRRHRLSSAQLSDIAWGRAGPEIIRVLYAADDSGHKLLAAHLLARDGGPEDSVLDALVALEEAERRDEESTAAVMRVGWFGSWVTRLRDGRAPTSEIVPVAAVAALRAGVRTRLTADVLDGQLHLPGLGTLTVPRATTVVLDVGESVVIDAGGVHLPVPAARSEVWSPVRTLDGAGLRLVVDDHLPGRDCFAMPLTEPLSDAAFEQWRSVVTEAWGLITRYTPEAASQIGAGMRVLVPLAPTPHGADASVSSADALGAIAATTPVDAVDFAIALPHEWSHSMLNGMINFGRLHDPRTSERFFAPWRPDPRPLGGTLHGSFAFLAVAEMWRALLADPAVHDRAETEFALRRLQVGEVLPAVAGSPGLTEQGRRFVAVLEERHAALLETSVSPRATAWATTELEELRAIWERRRRS